MPLYAPSDLDLTQVLQHAFDQETQTLRCLAVATILTPPQLQVIIDHTEDSIKIGDGSRLAAVTVSNALKVDGSAVTQPVSGTVSVSNFPATGDDLITMMDEASSTVTYVGSAEPGVYTSMADWRIKKILVSGTVTSILYADGNTSFDNVWDDRAGLVYS